jgi:hypothetical protein
MIEDPINDVDCLSKVTDAAMDASETEEVRDLASRFDSTRELAGWIRTLPQRNDAGDPDEGPKVSCDVPQRLRIPADDPNCVERAALFLAAGELIDPTAERQVATIDTPIGRHTFPVEDGRPIKLDPRVPRNALEAGLFRMSQLDAFEVSPFEAFEWAATIAAEPASRYHEGRERIRNAHVAFQQLLRGRQLPRNGIDDMTWALTVAEQAARAFGIRGMEIVRLGVTTLRHALRPTAARAPRNLSIRLGGFGIVPDAGTLSSLGRVGGRLGWEVGTAVLRAKLGSLGVALPVIKAVERELNREGLTLGGRAKPGPIPGSLGALTTEAMTKKTTPNAKAKAKAKPAK